MQPSSDVGAGHCIHLLQGAVELFAALVQAMDSARTDIQLETYIFNFTAAGSTVAQALVRAAQRGVRVRVVVDGVGTGPLPPAWQENFAAAGVQYQIYAPLGPLGLLIPSRWRRLHRKLCVVDRTVLFCGGINILDDYYDPHHGTLQAPRFDFAVQASGSLVTQASDVMEKLWQRMQAVRDVRQHHLPAAVRALRAAHAVRHQPLPQTGAVVRAALLLRDNLRNRTRIEKAYLRAIGMARDEIIIANAYFMPGRKLRLALVRAAQRGVRVQLLLQGRYEHFMQYHAARPIYGILLAAGVEIYEYAPSFLHAKVAVIDGRGLRPWATVGSSNLDPLSLLLAHEANVVIEDAAFAQQLRQRLVDAMQHAGSALDRQRYAQRPWRTRVLDRIAFGLMRTALWLTGKRY